MKRLLVTILVWSSIGHGTADDPANDFMAHFGSGFVAQTVCYGLAKSAWHLENNEKWKAQVSCGAANVVLFLLIQTVTAGNTGAVSGKDLRNDYLGIASAGVLTWTFKF